MCNFKYSAININRLIDESDCKKVCMAGVYNDLKRLKTLVEEFYDENIFYLSYWKNECVYHSWRWDKDDGDMKNMAKITDGITDKFKEIYALILAGLGERMKKEE